MLEGRILSALFLFLSLRMKYSLSPLVLSLFLLSACGAASMPKNDVAEDILKESEVPVASSASLEKMKPETSTASPKNEAEWKKILTPDQYVVLRQGGTEQPFSSDLLNEHRKGTFVTADCNEPVFRSEQKFDSGTGWPSFWAPITKDAVIEKKDLSAGFERTEVLSKCGGHLGHVFTDGPQPTGLRYCMNGLALKFIPD